MSGLYETWITRLRASWVAGDNAQGLLGAIGAVLGDKTQDEGEASLFEEIPSLASDAASLALHLAERQIEPGPSLDLDGQKALAAAAPNINRFRGRPLGMLLALYYADFPGAVLVQQNGKAFYIDGAPNLDDLAALLTWPATSFTAPAWLVEVDVGPNPAIPASTDGKPAIALGTIPWWSISGGPMDDAGNQWNGRFVVLNPDSGTDWGLSTAANLDRLRRVIAAWRPAKATCAGIFDLRSGAMWGWPPTLTWGTGNWGGTVNTYTAT